MSQGLDGAVGDATSVAIDTGVAFRDTGVGDLNRLFFGSNNGSVGGLVDDIYIDPFGQNLIHPAVPEPAAGGLIGVVGLLAALVARRRAKRHPV